MYFDQVQSPISSLQFLPYPHHYSSPPIQCAPLTQSIYCCRQCVHGYVIIYQTMGSL